MPTASIEIEDWPNHDLARRWGEMLPAHPEIEAVLVAGMDRYEALMREIAAFQPQFTEFHREPSEEHPQVPTWDNGFLPPFDTIALYGMVSAKKPKIYMEVGSGNSTKVAAWAKKKNSPDTRIISVDPMPTAAIDELCDEVVRGFFERCEAEEIYGRLSEGDIFFLDGTHRIAQNSDTTVFFLETLPRLASGVYIHIHDIFWPVDYPAAWKQRLYSEQYMLGLLLLFGWDDFEVVLPNYYVSTQTEMGALLDDTWQLPILDGIHNHGGSFWFRKR